MDRGQSQTIGAVLLTAIIALSVSTTGAVVLTDWESTLDDGPAANIDSEVTPINLTLSHRGGATLYPENTTIHLLNVEENTSFEAQFQPGDTLFEEFDRLDGTVEVVIVYEPLDTRVYSETHRIDNPIEGLRFAVAEETGPLYLLENDPTNYTVDRVYELGVPERVTAAANVTADDETVVDVDDGATTVTGLRPGRTAITAEENGVRTTSSLTILEDPQNLAVSTVEATPPTATSITATGELDELDELPDADLFFEYIPYRTVNEDPTDDSDGIITNGQYRDALGGYTHADGWLHDNRPLTEGDTRTYIYDEAGSGARYYWVFRDGEERRAARRLSSVRNDVYTGADGSSDLPDGTYRVEVSLSADGDRAAVRLYENLTAEVPRTERTDIDVSDHSELYFSTYGYFGDSGFDSLRLNGVYEASDVQRAEYDTVDTEQEYSVTIDGLDPDREYELSAVAERVLGNTTVSDSGDPITTNTSGPTVETVSVTRHHPTAITATGELVDLGDLDTVDLFFEHVPYRAVNEDPTDDSDGIITNGEYRDALGGYTHDDGWLHDNRPLTPGETRTYLYDEAGSRARYYWVFRDAEERRAERRISRVDHDVYTGADGSNDLPDGAYRIEVSLSADGETADVVLYDAPEDGTIVRRQTDIDVSAHSELYFSSYGYFGDSGADSLRLEGVINQSDRDRIETATDVDVEGNYSTNITGLEPYRDHAVTAYAEQAVGETTVTDSGDRVRFPLDGPRVMTRPTTPRTPVSATAPVEIVDMGVAPETGLGVEYVPFREVRNEPTANRDGTVSYGGYRAALGGYIHNNGWFHDNRPLTPGETRSYLYDEAGSTARYYWSFRNGEDSRPDDYYRNINNEVYNGADGGDDLPDGEYRIEVTLGTDGDTADVVLYDAAIGGQVLRSQTGIDVSAHSELYFSTYAWSGASGSSSLRMTGIINESERSRAAYGTVDTAGTYRLNVTGLDADRRYAVSAYTEEEFDGTTVADSDRRLFFNTTSPTVETLSAEAINATAVEPTAELVDLGSANSTNLTAEYVPFRPFYEGPSPNRDGIVTDGEYRPDLGGYTHGGGWLHDNRPLTEGETRIYLYDKADARTDYYWSLRDAQRVSSDSASSDIEHEVYAGATGRRDLPSGEFRIEVTLGEDGDTASVALYDDPSSGRLVARDAGIDVSNHSELYFSTYGWFDDEGEESVRLENVFDEPGRNRSASDRTATTTGSYRLDVAGLEPNREYAVAAVAQGEYENTTVADIGGWEFLNTTGPTVETVGATAVDATTVRATGELVDLGQSRQTDLHVAYTPLRAFNNDSNDNGDDILSDGAYRSDLGGYTHGGGWLHDNRPLTPGETRTYLYDKASSRTDYYWSFRDAERISGSDSASSDIEHEVYEGATGSPELPSGEFRIEVTLSEDGDTADVVLYDSLSSERAVARDTDIDVSAHSELYFSTFGWFDGEGDESVRLEGVFDGRDTHIVESDTAVGSEGPYSTQLNGLMPDQRYAVVARADHRSNGFNVTDTGGILRAKTDS